MGQSSSLDALSSIGQRLLNENLLPEDSIWYSIFTIPNNRDEIWWAYSAARLRQLRDERLKNFISLAHAAIHILMHAAFAPTTFLCRAPPSTSMVLNAARIISRLLPIIFESIQHRATVVGNNSVASTAELFDFHAWLWTRGVYSHALVTSLGVSGALIPVELSVTNAAHVPPARSAVPNSEAIELDAVNGLSIAELLMLSLLRLMFVRGSTVWSLDGVGDNDVHEGVHANAVWSHAGACLRGPESNALALASANVRYQFWTTYDGNRRELLIACLECFSQCLLKRGSEFDLQNQPFLAVLVDPPTVNAQGQASASPFSVWPTWSRTLLASLVNLVVSYEPQWPVWYVHQVLPDWRSDLVDVALQVLLVAFDYRPTDSRRNLWTEWASSQLSDPEMAALFFGLTRLLHSVPDADNTYLPYARNSVACYQEALVLLWKLVDLNPGFTEFISKRTDSARLTEPLLYFMHQYRKDVTKTGLVHACAFLLLRLSACREFGVSLNATFWSSTLPISDIPAFNGSMADLLVLIIHKFIVTSPEHLDSLLNVLLTVLANISPYLVKLSLNACVKLINLFELFSSPRFLFVAPDNHRFAGYLCEIFSNLIQYQFSSNARLIFSIIRRAPLFRQLFALELPTGDLAAVEFEQNGKLLQAMHESQVKAEGQHSIAIPAAASQTPSDMTDVDLQQHLSVEMTELSNTSSVVASSSPEVIASTTTGASAALMSRRQQRAALAAGTFQPNQAWFDEWHAELKSKCGAIVAVLDHMGARVEELCSRGQQNGLTVTEAEVLDFIENTPLAGLLPAPHSLTVRRYQPSMVTDVWFATYVWGIIYLRHQFFPLFDAESVRLFSIVSPQQRIQARHQQQQQQQQQPQASSEQLPEQPQPPVDASPPVSEASDSTVVEIKQ